MHIRGLLTSNRCDQSNPDWFLTPIFQSLDKNHCGKGIDRHDVPHLQRDHALFLRAWREKEEPQSCTAVNGVECAIIQRIRRDFNLVDEDHSRKSGEKVYPLMEIGQAICLTYPSEDGMKRCSKRALGLFGYFGRISTEIPARIFRLYGDIVRRPDRQTGDCGGRDFS